MEMDKNMHHMVDRASSKTTRFLQQSNSSFDDIKAKIYVVGLIIGILALVLALVFTYEGQLFHQILIGILLIWDFGTLVVLLTRKYTHIKYIDAAIIVGLVYYSSIKLLQYDFSSMDNGFMYWIAVMYTIIFFAARGKKAFLFSASILTVHLLIGLLSTDFSQLDQMELNGMIQFYYANLVYISLLYFMQFLKKMYMESRQLHIRAHTDFLTGIPNRRKMYVSIQENLEQYQEKNQPFALIIFDVDHFKQVNDNYSHHTGDKVLQEMSVIVRRALDPVYSFGRWGGEEFVVVLPNTDFEKAFRVAEELRQVVEKYEFSQGIHITCSFGISVFQADDTINSLLKKADAALYSAKSNGRNRSEYFA